MGELPLPRKAANASELRMHGIGQADGVSCGLDQVSWW
jgi:hypothetical protein